MKLEQGFKAELYRTMVKIRLFEQAAVKLFAAGKLPGFLHLYIGEEAVATGVCAAIGKEDYITSTHRGHGHLLAKGGDLHKMMAELYGKETGYCKGKGGSMHIADMDIGILGANGIVGAGLPIATGAGFASKYKDNGRVSVCFFGDGASNRGTFHESINLASILKLPVVYVCENNLYGISVCQRYHMNIENIADRGASYGIPGVSVDGNNVTEVYAAAVMAVERAKGGEGPTLIECKTWRQRGHFEGDPGTYRDKEEEKEWLEKDPIVRYGERLIAEGGFARADLDKIESEVAADLDDAIKEAEAASAPQPKELYEDVFYVEEAVK